MLLRNSISKTKKFFQRTIQGFKSLMSNGGDYYHKLPKTPPFINPFSCGNHDRRGASYDMSYKELDKLYTDFTNQWDAGDDDEKKKTIKKIASPVATIQEREEERQQQQQQQQEKCSSLIMREKRPANLVAEKLKEMVMMDVGNVEHVLDIEEVLHYYSRLTCPAYLDIVDKFFMDMYTEFFSPSVASSTHSISCTDRLRTRYR